MNDTPAELLALAEGDPQAAVTAAESVIASTKDLATRAHALRAMGLARRNMSDAAGSVETLNHAMDAAEASGDDTLLGEVGLTLAVSVAFTGDLPAAFALLDDAEARLDEVGQARVKVQRAGLMARSGDLPGALPLYAEAEPVLTAHDDQRWLALLSSNRGLVFTFMADFANARADLERARDLYAATGQASSSAEMTQNLGFLLVQQGDIPGALAALDDAERRLTKLGMGLGEVQLDRAHALLLAGLAEEAADIAYRAAETLSDAELEIERSEALVLAARAALASADYTRAAQAAGSAAVLMAAQERPGWELRARYLALAARSAEGKEVSPTDLVETADALTTSGQLYPALHSRLLAGRAALEHDDMALADEQLGAAGTIPSTAPVDIRVQAWLAKALLRRSQGKSGSALAAVRAGVRVLDDYRATLGATESRINVARHARELYDLGLRMALESGQPGRLLNWIDVSRSGVLRLVPPKPPEDDELVSALAELRVAQSDVREAEVEGEFSREMWREQTRIEQQVRRLAMRQRGAGLADRDVQSLASLQKELGDRTMVVFMEISGELVGIRVRNRSIRMTDLGDSSPIWTEAEHMRSAMRSLAIRPDRASRAAFRSLEHSARILDERLFGPMNVTADDLIVAPPPRLHSIPWHALPSCATRSLSIAPSPYAWHKAHTTAPATGSVLLVAGPGLEQAEPEVEALQSVHPDAVTLAGGEATVGNVLEALEGAEMAHFACHASFRSDNAMFSALQMADGDLTVYDLERLVKGPQTVVLSACDSGLSETAAGEELMGLSTALLGMGTRSLIVSVAPIPDAPPTRRMMQVLHEGLLAGNSPATAMAGSRAALVDDDRNTVVARDAFFCLGA